ncbi:hypothetical protein [Streptomyces sioyaensis]|uniref:hypothetical protein n=1 Tax=Streptomyces sioyaensis TaxID=67364 RepID=UPI0037150B61
MANDGESTNAGWTREQWLALAGAVGVPLAIVALLFGNDLWGKFQERSAETSFSAYVTESDRTCAKYGPDLAALGEDQWQQGAQVYAAQIRKKSEVLQSILNDWQTISIPDKEEQAKEVQALAQSSIRQYEIAANVMEKGEVESANAYIADAGKTGMQSITKARSLGFEVCPGGR